MTTDEEIDRWLAWKDRERRKHRTMTLGEYIAWSRGGDAISHSSEANPFPGGLTILLNTPPIIGRASDSTDSRTGS